MNIRRLFNFSSKMQQAIISADVTSVLEKCQVIANAEYKDQKDAQESHDNVCPNCQARKDKIVNKISNVEGSGKVNGLFHLGYGNVNGSMSITTDEVRHCNVCGNEWKTYKLKYVSKTEISRVALKYLAAIITDPKEKQYNFKVETIKVFDDCYLETILHLVKENELYLNSSSIEVLTYKRLRYYFKSIYDKSSRKLVKL